MPREVEDPGGVRWSCAAAYAGLQGDDGGDPAEARVEGSDHYRVICTPSGGSRSVELELPEGWEDALSDDELLEEIGRGEG